MWVPAPVCVYAGIYTHVWYSQKYHIIEYCDRIQYLQKFCTRWWSHLSLGSDTMADDVLTTCLAPPNVFNIKNHWGVCEKTLFAKAVIHTFVYLFLYTWRNLECCSLAKTTVLLELKKLCECRLSSGHVCEKSDRYCVCAQHCCDPTCKCMFECAYAHVCVCACLCIYRCVSVRMCVCVRACNSVRVYMCVTWANTGHHTGICTHVWYSQKNHIIEYCHRIQYLQILYTLMIAFVTRFRHYDRQRAAGNLPCPA